MDAGSPGDAGTPLDAEEATAWHRSLAMEANNGTYALLDALGDDPDPDAVDAVVHQAHAAAHHWRLAGGTVVQRARAEYLCARVHACVGHGAAALHHAQRCRALLVEAGDEAADWDHAFAHEAHARALAALGDHAGAQAEVRAALAVPIADPEDAEIVDTDLRAGPWYGLVVPEAR